jgi:ubiquinone/menaquinone biosynthesis C-methylase UbiE
MKEGLKKIIKVVGKGLIPIKPFLVFLFEAEAWISKCWAAASHKRLFWVTWGIPKRPESFDHHIDLLYFWQNSRISHWLERGVYNTLALKSGGTLLEIACGDGFNARNFYSGIVKTVIACDLDKKALATAKWKNKAPNIEFVLADVRYAMPGGDFDNIVCDMAMEHFNVEEIESLMVNIKNRLSKKNGIFSGTTIVEKDDGKKSLEQHEYEFKNMADLKRFLDPYFKNVIVFETIYPSRHNLYFWASDATIPFSNNWGHWIKSND